jgi:hypothetical protein
MPASKDTPRKPLVSTVAKARAFLAAFRATANVTKSAKAAGINPRSHYRWLKENAAYAAAYAEAEPIATRFLLDRTIEGCTDGWLEVVYYQGVAVGAVRRFDLGGRQFLLRGLMPEKFGVKVEHTGPGGGALQSRVEVVFVDAPQREPARLVEMPKTA